MSSPNRSVGFAGLGAMGFDMALNLLEGSFQVAGYDLNPTALENFITIGGSIATTVSEASVGQDVFLVMVATPAQVDSLLFSEDGLVVFLPTSAILCLLNTVPPKYVSELPARLAEKGRGDIRLLDCPVSGGAVGAVAGTLSIMIGGDKGVFEGARAIPRTDVCTGQIDLLWSPDNHVKKSLEQIFWIYIGSTDEK